VIWGNAHGSFVLAYALLGAYLACWAGMRLLDLGVVSLSDRQAVALAGVVTAALLLTLFGGPFGTANFIHPGKVAASNLWRLVAEWQPPYIQMTLAVTSMVRFWLIFGLLLALVLVLPLIATRTPAQAVRQRRGETSARYLVVPTMIAAPVFTWRNSAEPFLQAGMVVLLVVAGVLIVRCATLLDARESRRRHFDLLMIAAGLALAMWARRFAPLFYLFTAPIVGGWATEALRGWCARHAAEAAARRAPWVLAAILLLGAGWVATTTWERFRADLVRPFAGMPSLPVLQRVTGYDQLPDDAISYLARNELAARLVTTWRLSGMVMFRAPRSKVFIDGRAQQLYDERIFLDYMTLFGFEGVPPPGVTRDVLDRHAVNCMLLIFPPPYMARDRATWDYAVGSPEWAMVVSGKSPAGDYAIFVRVADPLAAEIARRIASGREWRPAQANAYPGREDFVRRVAPAT
jgi:hypothetical protein